MKNILMLATLVPIFMMTSLSQSYALSQIPVDMLKNKNENVDTNLDIQTILKTAYPKTLTEPMAYAEPKALSDYFKKLQQEQLEKNVLGFFHPVIPFQNIHGEARYLVVVEKVEIYDGYIQSCSACSSSADFLIYKKQNNEFVLINSAKDQTAIPSSDGHFLSNFLRDLKANLQPFGIDKMGSYSKATYSGAGGQEESIWYAVLLPDAGKMQALQIGSAGGSTESYYAGRPHLGSSTTSTLKIIPNKTKYYPIEVTYIDNGNTKKSYKSVFKYSDQQSKYVEKKVK